MRACWTQLRTWARNLKNDVVALWLAARDPRVPWYAKLVAGMVAAYALSPIDLIPDFIPILGYADDLLIVPLGILLAIRLIPTDLVEEHRRAARAMAERPTSRAAATVIVSLCDFALAIAAWNAFRLYRLAAIVRTTWLCTFGDGAEERKRGAQACGRRTRAPPCAAGDATTAAETRRAGDRIQQRMRDKSMPSQQQGMSGLEGVPVPSAAGATVLTSMRHPRSSMHRSSIGRIAGAAQLR